MIESNTNITNFISATGNDNENALEVSYGVAKLQVPILLQGP
jgi:hypothetical protein